MKNLTYPILALAAFTFLISPLISYSKALSDQQKISRLTRELIRLPHRANSYSKVKPLVTELTRIYPKKAYQYFSIGIRRLQIDQIKKRGPFLYTRASRILKKSSLSEKEKAKILGRMVSLMNHNTFPTPTPEPEQGAAANP